ncbi:MAG: hypothetical protein ABMA00_21120 [Gemmatimonas sp.]
MSADRHVLAQAERLALFSVGTLRAAPATVLEIVTEWRDKYSVPLSDGACALIVAHVCEYDGSLRETVR